MRDPEKLYLLAQWHDENDEKTGREGTEVQNDLRRIAASLTWRIQDDTHGKVVNAVGLLYECPEIPGKLWVWHQFARQWLGPFDMPEEAKDGQRPDPGD